MFNLVRTITRITRKPTNIQRRTFLSQAYYCKEVWDQRFLVPIIQNTRIDDLYNQLDQRYSKFKNISAVDVDIFANAVNDVSYTDELLDLIHKLRMSADSYNTLNSTSHAVVRNLVDFGKIDELLTILDDRLNYGLFLDNFTAILLLDTFWKNKDYMSGSRIASQLMLQEDFEHPLCAALALLHCYNYLKNPTEWPQPPKPEEPEDEVKVRVNYMKNPYDDQHFDLRNPLQIVGKTIKMITSGKKDALEKSLYLVGVALFDGSTGTDMLLADLVKNETVLYEEVIKLVPKDLLVQSIKTQQTDVHKLLEERVKLAMEKNAEKDIALQCETYLQWEKEREQALEKQHQRLLTAQRLSDIQEIQTKLKEKEKLLWYFDNEETIELQIEEKDALLAEKSKDSMVPINTEEVYIPPEVHKKYETKK